MTAKIEDHVVSRELSKELYDLGMRRESCFYWVWSITLQKWAISSGKPLNQNERFSYAYLSSELGEMFPPSEILYCKTRFFDVDRKQKEIWHTFMDNREDLNEFIEQREVDSRAKMLIHLLKEGHLKPEDVNK